ncbi:hypothetical protein HMI54_009648 [Coelomomyces lativittatus]|nr:hypothetical protein HMI54_009648 [Coelomomyces lativittatus]
MVPFVSPAPIENFSTDSLFPAFNLMSTTTCLPTSPLSLSKEALISNNTNSHSLTHHPNYFTTKQQPSSTSSFHPVFTSSRATSTSTSSLLKKSFLD